MSAHVNRQEQQEAFVLHTYPYRETSLLAEVFTRQFGRLTLLARGARRPRSEVRGVLRAFQPLHLSWHGSGEIKTLTKAEWLGGIVPPAGSMLMSAFYLNDLLLRFLPREDAHAALYDGYQSAVRRLSESENSKQRAALLRRFEITLLAELGYAMHLTHDSTIRKSAADGENMPVKAPLEKQRRYHYIFESGPLAAEGDQTFPGAPIVRGATLMALANDDYPDAHTVAEAQRLMAQVLGYFLENRRLPSRHIAQDLRQLKRLSRTVFDEKTEYE